MSVLAHHRAARSDAAVILILFPQNIITGSVIPTTENGVGPDTTEIGKDTTTVGAEGVVVLNMMTVRSCLFLCCRPSPRRVMQWDGNDVSQCPRTTESGMNHDRDMVTLSVRKSVRTYFESPCFF